METKINLHLCANYNVEEFKSAVINSIICDYTIEKLRLAIKRLSKEDLDVFYVQEDFKNIIDKGSDITFSSLSTWEKNRIDTYTECFELLMRLDFTAATEGKIEAGKLSAENREDIESYLVQLSLCDISPEGLDFTGVDVKQEFIDNLLSQLILVDEGKFLSDLGTMQLEMVPLDTNKHRNKFIEKKLKRARELVSYVSDVLEKDFDRLHEEIMVAYKKFYKIAYAALSDGEKVDEARKVCKLIASHRHVLDKMEDKLTEANEIKRQLTLHERKLKEWKAEQESNFETLIQETPHEREGLERELDGVRFVCEDYIVNIHTIINKINAIEDEITSRYKIVDRVEVAIKGAIPSESEMKRYSAISFKFEDLYVRLELAKSQIKDKDKDFVTAINTAITGLGVLINLGLEGKDVFMRNNLLSAVFNSVNGIYDLVDNKNKSIELSQINFVTTRLVQYSMLNKNLTKDLQTFRHVANNAIRDIAMMMGKPFSFATMIDIIDTIDIAIKQVQEIVDTLNKNHVEQTQVLGDILNV